MGGRPPGKPNVAVFEKKSLIKYLKEEGAERFLKLLETLPDDVFCDKYLKLIEFAFPKEKQVLEHTGKDGVPLPPSVSLTVIDAKAMEIKERFEEELRKKLIG